MKQPTTQHFAPSFPTKQMASASAVFSYYQSDYPPHGCLSSLSLANLLAILVTAYYPTPKTTITLEYPSPLIVTDIVLLPVSAYTVPYLIFL